MTKEQINHIVSLNNQRKSIEKLLSCNGYPNKIILQEWDDDYNGIMMQTDAVDCNVVDKVVQFLKQELERIDKELESM